MRRLEEPGWERVGQVCSAGHRSLWMRITMTPGHEDDGVYRYGPGNDECNVDKLEMCAGRDGEDDYILITRDNPQFDALLEVMLSALFAATS